MASPITKFFAPPLPLKMGHQPVEERIDQRPVKEQEQICVECLQPVHWRHDSGEVRRWKTE